MFNAGGGSTAVTPGGMPTYILPRPCTIEPPTAPSYVPYQPGFYGSDDDGG
jgi:hypothetical protein